MNWSFNGLPSLARFKIISPGKSLSSSQSFLESEQNSDLSPTTKLRKLKESISAASGIKLPPKLPKLYPAMENNFMPAVIDTKQESMNSWKSCSQSKLHNLVKLAENPIAERWSIVRLKLKPLEERINFTIPDWTPKVKISFKLD